MASGKRNNYGYDMLTLNKHKLKYINLIIVFLFSVICFFCSKNINEPVSVPLIEKPTYATAVLLSINKVKLDWTDNSKLESGYMIERSRLPLKAINIFDTIAVLPQNTTSYIDTGIFVNQTVQYIITAISGNTKSIPDTVTLNSLYNLSINFSISLVNDNAVKLTWENTDQNYTEYIIEKYENQSSTPVQIHVPPNISCYVDSDLSIKNTYVYRVCPVIGNQMLNTSSIIRIKYADGLKEYQNFAGGENMSSVCFIPGSSNFLLSNNGNIKLYDKSNSIVKIFNDDNEYLTVSADGNYFATSSLYNNYIKIWNITTGSLIKSIRWNYNSDVYPPLSTRMVLSKDGSLIAYYYYEPNKVYLNVCRTSDNSLIWNKWIYYERGSILGLSPDGTKIIFNDGKYGNDRFDRGLFTANLNDGSDIIRIGNYNSVASAGFSPSGKYMYIFISPHIKIWDYVNSRQIEDIDLSGNTSLSIYFLNLRFSNDDKLLYIYRCGETTGDYTYFGEDLEYRLNKYNYYQMFIAPNCEDVVAFKGDNLIHILKIVKMWQQY